MNPLYGAALACGYVTLKWACDGIEQLTEKKWLWAAFNLVASIGMASSTIAVWRMIP